VLFADEKRLFANGHVVGSLTKDFDFEKNVLNSAVQIVHRNLELLRKNTWTAVFETAAH